MEPLYIEKAGKKLRCGYTTGSCAAAASKAALLMLLSGKDIHNVSIKTPKGPVYNAEIMDIKRDKNCVSCAVIKDAGDDPDVTNGAYIYSAVSLKNESGILIKDRDKKNLVKEIKKLFEDKTYYKKYSDASLKNTKQYEVNNIKPLWNNLIK